MRGMIRNNVDKIYTEHSQAQFRVIKIDPARIGGPNARADALARIQGIRERAIDAVDKAVWRLKPGELTDIIEDGGAFYLAKLEARKDGRIRPFEDQAVQDAI